MKTFSFSRPKRLFNSVFTKILAIGLITWLCILIAALSIFIITRHTSESPFLKNLGAYAQYIINDLGTPPDLDQAEEISQKTGLHITYISKEQRWSTRRPFPEIEELRYRSFHGDTTLQFRRRAGHHIIKYQSDHGLFFFESMDEYEEREQNAVYLLILLTLLSLILFFSYLTIRRVLAPLRWVYTAVHKVKDGDFSHQVPVRGNDELTDLAGGFNEMTSQLKTMLENKENLLRDVSHELRTPLTRIRVALEFLEDSTAKKDISEDVQAIEKMIENILQTSRTTHRANKLERQEVNLAEITKTVADRYTDSLPRVICKLPKEPCLLLADPLMLQSLLTNCIDNGLKFSETTADPVNITLNKEGDKAIISIIDYGCGIEENELPFIFEPFYRVDQSRSRQTGGFGLGLPICKTIVEAHDGTISIESKKDQGTTVIITLPCVD